MNAGKNALVQNVKPMTELGNHLSASEAALQEQLALRRLRQVVWRNHRRKVLSLTAGAVKAPIRLVVWVVLAGLEGAELVQQVAPHRPALRRHEWDQVKFRPQF